MTNQETPDPQSSKRGEPEAVWTYRGYQLRPSEFTTAMVHLFRAEVQRANVWRQRLDSTTNWAVITTGAAISFAFSRLQPRDHNVIILDVLLVTLFLYIEARRYRYYELWSSRVRLMETDFFATMLVPPFHPAPDWAETLAENLLQPHLPISLWEALGRRFRRNYLWIYMVLNIAWLAKVWLHPMLTTSWSEFLLRARIGAIPGEVILTAGLIFNGLLMAIGLLTVGLQQATGEVLPRFETFHLPNHVPGKETPSAADRFAAWFRPSRRRQQLLAFIVTDKARAVADRILSDMGRGVTALSGMGMYTEESHAVLMCAITVTEAPSLRASVLAKDPQAFVMLTPAQEVLGKGFVPLRTDMDDRGSGRSVP
ncbi:MAG: DUF2270 domain-containing protein [Anaerolineae bacterium]|nr:DUF2270 domain-containing protein [Anaerolineae bacterium]